jgi:hypothetical protein
MFGLEKKPKAPFEFDLEKELKRDHNKLKELLDKVSKQKQELKTNLRTGTDKKDYEEGGILLQAFEALETVLKRFSSKHHKG